MQKSLASNTFTRKLSSKCSNSSDNYAPSSQFSVLTLFKEECTNKGSIFLCYKFNYEQRIGWGKIPFIIQPNSCASCAAFFNRFGRNADLWIIKTRPCTHLKFPRGKYDLLFQKRAFLLNRDTVRSVAPSVFAQSPGPSHLILHSRSLCN